LAILVGCDRFKLSVAPAIDLSKLTMAEKDALSLSLLPLVDRLATALARITELEQAVVTDLIGAIRPMVWVSDTLGIQRGHAVEWQVCLAHLLRDARYAVECGDVAFSAAFKCLLLRAITIGRRRDKLKVFVLAARLPTQPLAQAG
jgi:hypothetical protein